MPTLPADFSVLYLREEGGYHIFKIVNLKNDYNPFEDYILYVPVETFSQASTFFFTNKSGEADIDSHMAEALRGKAWHYLLTTHRSIQKAHLIPFLN